MKCCDLVSSNLREPVTIQRKMLIADGLGGSTVHWIDLFTTRAQVMPLSGREAVQAMQIQDSVTHRIYIRYRADVFAADRIVIRGEPLQVRAVMNLEMRNRWLEIACQSGVAT